MIELLLNRLALEKLDVVDDKEIDCPQSFLESDRRLRFEGGDETVHESLSGEIDNLVLCRGGSMRDGLEKVGLTQSDRSMEIKWIEQQWVSRRRESDPLRRGMGELVGCTDEKIRENQTAIQRRPRESFRLVTLHRGRFSRRWQCRGRCHHQRGR